ncbi:MAG TPA: septum formation initiator family protein [Gemmatimonadaceae bacterium]|nr:septum formation initiator family protein [Gemmatimonadaceae bacterium]
MASAAAKTWGKRVGVALGVAAIAWFAIQGGEYGTFDILSQKSRRASLQREVDSLQTIVDSLVGWKHLVENDARVQERIAREEFGMVRGNKEMLYRFIGPDSGR